MVMNTITVVELLDLLQQSCRLIINYNIIVSYVAR